MSAGRHWAYAELKRRLATRKTERADNSQPGEIRIVPEYGTVFLFNPEARESLDDEIHSRYFPAVIEGLRGNRICVHDEETVLSQISDKRDSVATRQLVFLLEEPPQPLAGPDSPPWFVRGTIDCSLESCMILFDLILSLPQSIDLGPVLELMGDRRLQGIPPALSIESRLTGEQEYTLHFSWGRGSAVGMEYLITECIRKHVAIIEVVNRLAMRWSSHELFSDLSAKLITMYGDNIQ